MESYPMIMNWRNWYFKDIHTIQTIYRFSATHIKIPMTFFTKIEKYSKLCMGPQMTLNRQSNQSWRHHKSWFQMMLQSYDGQSNMVPAWKQRHRPVEQSQEFRSKPSIIDSSLARDPRTHRGRGTVSSINAARKTGQ